MSAFLNTYKNYFRLSGRATRTEFWLFQLWGIILHILIIVLYIFFGPEPQIQNSKELNPIEWISMLIVFFGYVVPTIALIVRRLHDSNHSGGFFFLLFCTCIGALVVLIFMFLPGTQGPNDYGEDPRQKPIDTSNASI